MITGEQKTIEEIRRLIAPARNVLILGCGTCVTVCFAGGEKEVSLLTSVLRLADREGGQQRQLLEHTVKRQCEWEFLDEIADKVKEADAVLSLACGVGVQALAERFPDIPVLPGLNTLFMGLPQEQGVWNESCLGCGDCLLGLTGGICPITRCAKSLLNGPCGGSVKGKCELSPDVPCAWQLIYDRLAALGILDRLEEIQPPKDWSTSHAGGPRQITREELKSGS
jgi:ferredoxin